MDDGLAIKLERVSKKYCKDIRRSMIYGMADIGRNLMGRKSCGDKLRNNEFWAVDDVSFEVKEGETLGIIGSNGSGKTTLLKMLNGIFWPDKGKITIKGKVGALIAVGAGFHPQLSGRENIYVNGAILGMSKQEIDEKFDAIIDFADISDFLDAPVKHYSSGMYVRLGFAIAVHSNCDILLVDEVLAVGDMAFQAKCVRKIQEIRSKGVTTIFISHNLNSVEMLCDRVVYLNKGRIQLAGSTIDALNEFRKDALKGKVDIVHQARYGTKEAEITKVEFLNKDGVFTDTFKRGEPLRIRIVYTAKKILENPHFAVAFGTVEGTTVTVANTRDHGIPIKALNGTGEIEYRVDSLPYNIGKYLVSVGCWDSTGHVAYDHHNKMYQLIVEDGAISGKIRERFGLVYVPARWDTSKIDQQTDSSQPAGEKR